MLAKITYGCLYLIDEKMMGDLRICVQFWASNQKNRFSCICSSKIYLFIIIFALK
jgi:hypothetical protein